MWLRDLVLHEPLNGVHGEVGTTSRVVLQTGKQQMEATETLTRREPADLTAVPSDTVVHYEREIVAKGMWNAARERLTEAGPGATLWVSESEYRFSSAPMRLMSRVVGGVFRTQSLQYTRDFTAVAEKGTDVGGSTG
ncbi:MAG: SRPBCC family protein [Pseudonocardia sp.]|uniref:SRPBCC family protein n=1 Tax=unclassified Pseudonocardia TaxID=2619320 RepID=UPI001AC4256C|nr:MULTISPECIES: SRPBCC family protein [unclassified Pseudonocardia]MBN9111349.1 SRPBCC family protein [Pseudonocardia sp.]